MNPFESNAPRETKAFLNSQNIPIVVSMFLYQIWHILETISTKYSSFGMPILEGD